MGRLKVEGYKMKIFETKEMSELPESTDMEPCESDPPGWRSGLGLRRKAKAFVKQHLDGARKMIEDSFHNLGDKIVTLQTITDPSKDPEHVSGSEREASPDVVIYSAEVASQGPEAATQESTGVEILGPLSRDVHERLEGAKKILKSSMATIGDTAGSLLRFNADTSPIFPDAKDDTESDETSIAPIPPPSPPPGDTSISTVASAEDGQDSAQKNVWNPIRKAIDGIVQPSQQIGKHLIQVWDLHDLVDDLKEQRNLWRQRKAKDSKETEAEQGEATESRDAEEPKSEIAPANAPPKQEKLARGEGKVVVFL